MTDTQELKPCPFCGSDDISLYEVPRRKNCCTIRCEDCVAEPRVFDAADTYAENRREAIKCWNTRAAPPEVCEKQNANGLPQSSLSEAGFTQEQVQKLVKLLEEILVSHHINYVPKTNDDWNYKQDLIERCKNFLTAVEKGKSDES
jgi:Lar family restriction alleviation protein